MITAKDRADYELFFEFLIIKGLKKHDKINNPKYVARAKYEFDRMINKKYSSYFLAVWEYVKWAKKNKIRVGPGRGCFTGDTKISLLDGREVTLKYLADNYKDKKFWVYSCTEDGKIVAGKAFNPRATKKANKILKITLDNGEIIKCTQDHRFMLRNGEYCEANNLIIGQSLMPLYREYTEKGYEKYFDNKESKSFFTHYLNFIKKHGFVVHHKDFNKRNNCCENLEQLSNKKHGDLHAKFNSDRWKDPVWRKEAIERYWKIGAGSKENREKTKIRNKDPEFRKKVSEGQKRVWQDKAYRERMLVIINSEQRKEKSRKRFIALNKSIEHRELIKNRNKDVAFRKKVSEGKKKYYQTEKGITEKKMLSKRMSILRKSGVIMTDKEKEKMAKYNHKVINIEEADIDEYVYDIEVERYHNFALSAGVFVHNSAGGSLVAMLLGITEPDPIEHNLLFTRFLSPIRKDAPDIDLDFADNRRKEIFEHLVEVYGEKNTAQVGTFSRFHAKGVMRDIGRIFEIPIGEIEKICGLVIERCISGDSKIMLSDGTEKQIEELFIDYENGKKNKQGISFFLHKGKFKQQGIKSVSYAGKKQMYKIILESGKEIEASDEHKFLTKTGWKMLKDLKEDDEIMTCSEDVDYVKCKICGKILREVNSDHLKKHGINKSDYYKRFNTRDVCKEVSKRKGWQAGKPYVGRKLFGSENPMADKKNKAKWYEKINDKDRRKKHSDFMKKNNPMYNKEIASKVMKNFSKIFKNGSKPQKLLYKIIRKNYSGKIAFDFFLRTKRSYRFLDVAIIKEKIDFEYDGSFWHETNKDRRDDLRRKREIEEMGWTVISIKEKDLSEDNIKKILEGFECLKK